MTDEQNWNVWAQVAKVKAKYPRAFLDPIMTGRGRVYCITNGKQSAVSADFSEPADAWADAAARIEASHE